MYATMTFGRIYKFMWEIVCWHIVNRLFYLNINSNMEKKALSIFNLLKPKAQALGFTKEELEEVAVTIAEGIEDEEPADEVMNAKIDAVIPVLKVSQTAVNRIVNAKKNEPDPTQTPDPNKGKGGNATQPTGDLSEIITQAVNAAIKPLNDKIITLESERREESYSAKLRTDLKDVDEDYFSTLLVGRKFESDEDYNSFVSSVKSGWEKVTQKFNEKGLTFTPPGKGGKPDEEVSGLVSAIDAGTKQIVEQRK